jgi:hypothetical protein
MDKLKTISDYEAALEKAYNANEKNSNGDNKFDIVYSVTYHEQALCILDQLLNILTFNHLNKIIVLFSVNDSIFNELKTIKFPQNMAVSPHVRSSHARMIWNTNLLAAHMTNFELVKHIKFDYFCMLASNEMFIKNVDLNVIKKNIILKKKEFVPSEPVKIMDKLNSWVHYKPFLSNFYMCSFFIKNNLEPFSLQHEGLMLPKSVWYEINKMYKKDNFCNKTINLQDFLLEEVLIATYLHNHYDFNDYVLTYRDFDSYAVSLKEINETNLYSVKRVPRIFNNDIRMHIRSIYVNYLTSCLNIQL